jgi:hypothetical protein
MAKTLPTVDRYGTERARDFALRFVEDDLARSRFPDARVRLGVALGQLYKFGCDKDTIFFWVRRWPRFADLVSCSPTAAAASAPSSAEKQAGFPVAGIVSSGQAIESAECGGLSLVVDLGSLSIPPGGVDVCLYHNEHLPIGRFKDLQIQNGRLAARGSLNQTSEAEEVARALRRDDWVQTSIGANMAILEFVDENETVRVNGRRLKPPALIARAASLREVSICRDRTAVDRDAYLTQYVQLYEPGPMPDRLNLIRATTALERKRREAAADLARFCREFEQEQARQRQVQGAIAAQQRTDEALARETNRRRDLAAALESRGDTVRAAPWVATGDTQLDRRRREQQQQREPHWLRTSWGNMNILT